LSYFKLAPDGLDELDTEHCLLLRIPNVHCFQCVKTDCLLVHKIVSSLSKALAACQDIWIEDAKHSQLLFIRCLTIDLVV